MLALNVRRLSGVVLLIVIVAVLLYPSFATGIVVIKVTDSGEKIGESLLVRCRELALHRNGESDSIGWITVINQTSSFNLVELGNLTETLVKSRITAGRYDKIRFTISEASMTFNATESKLGIVAGQVTIPLSFAISSGETVVIIDFRTDFKQTANQRIYRSSPVAYVPLQR